MNVFDVCVIGGGHAGCEAANIASKINLNTLLITLNIDEIALTPCNPAMGGPGKSQLIRDLDALGGIIAEVTDYAAIQYRILNSKKGKAAQALRAQVDLWKYKSYMKRLLLNKKNLTIIQGEVINIIKKNNYFIIETKEGLLSKVKAIVIATGTFLRGKIFIGDFSMPAGRIGESPSIPLYKSLKDLGVKFMRLKTGTCARIDKKSIDFSKFEVQPSENIIFKFTHYNYDSPQKTLPCYITHTNEKTHKIIKKNIKYSPLFSGKICGIGPRYCPSIEDKIIKFPNKKRHIVFLEPVGLNSSEIYLQGLTTSLPEKIQKDFISTIPGLENVHILKPGYAVEYDCLYPLQLRHTLEHRNIPNLYFAGQINGTSGYEEAAAQGFIAGINAALKIKGKNEFFIKRSESMIGILIDDIVTKEIKEPYRLFPSTSEYMIYTRQDNSDLRLIEKGFKFGLIPKEKYEIFITKSNWIQKSIKKLYNIPVKYKNRKINAYQYLKIPETHIKDIKEFKIEKKIPEEFIVVLETIIKYEGYIKKQKYEHNMLEKWKNLPLPKGLDVNKINGISSEAKQKITMLKPLKLGELFGIAGITNFDLLVLKKFIDKNYSIS